MTPGDGPAVSGLRFVSRIGPMRASALLLLPLLSACTCEPFTDGLVFTCHDTADCAPGFLCQQGVCLEATRLDGGDDGGAPDAGAHEDGGEPDGGGDAGAWWDEAWAHRQSVLIFTTSAATGPDYAVRVEVDHAALVDAGLARADGHDLRVVCGGEERDRVVDTGHGWNLASTRVWFRAPRALPANSVNRECFLYYGASDAPAPPATPSQVFLLFDGFESGDLSGWNQEQPGLWQLDSSQTHGGSAALHYPPEAAGRRELSALPALHVADVLVEAWFSFGLVSQDMALRLRVTPGSNSYETSHQTTGGWNLAKVVDTTWQQLLPPSGSALVTPEWTRVGFALHGTRASVFIGDEVRIPASGGFDLGADFDAGNVGINKFLVRADGGGVWIDDLLVRPWVDPEPTVQLGPRE